MPDRSPNPDSPSAEELRDLSCTLSARPVQRDLMVTRLQFVADLLADSGPLPQAPLLLWRGTDGTVRQVTIENEVVVGREPGGQGLALTEDKMLSRRHFAVRSKDGECSVEDLKSHNGTAVNEAAARVDKQRLHDGDLIFAGNQVFAFLDHRRSN
jgi:hypothetical protein